MQLGFIESAKTSETTERKRFWNEQLAKADLDDKYHAVAHRMPGVGGTSYFGIFIEEKPADDGG